MDQLADFAALYPFGLDRFQRKACRALLSGSGVLVAAPTGSGKTVIGEFAVHLALASGTKCFYTTPIKALSNQKYHDLVARYGPERVGLLTGDNSVNGDAAVVVMTTEVLRNMIYAESATLEGLAFAVMDEVHYLADRERGAVWEEVIINLPEHVSVVALSATVSNAEEFGAWLDTVRGQTAVIVEEHRPVPLWQHVYANGSLHDLFVEDSDRAVNPDLLRIARHDTRGDKARSEIKLDRHSGGSSSRFGRRPERGGSRPRPTSPPARAEVVEVLRREGLLPCINFIFSRAGCEAAVEQVLRSGLRLTTSTERAQIRARAMAHTQSLPDADLTTLGFQAWLAGLERGVAAHHAGLIPTFKEAVEELFQAGLIKVVYATETLALGINMPAKAVVLEKLVKWNGEAHAEMTAGEYTQLTGRAGRRGIDLEGHAVVLWYRGLDPTALAGLAAARTYPLRSSFTPSYNMAVNLVLRLGRAAAREVLQTSFAQFQADRSFVGLARTIARNEEAIAGYRQAMACHLGDFGQYAALREEISTREKGLARTGALMRRSDTAAALAALQPGDVIVVPAGRRAGVGLVVDPGLSEGEDPRPFVLTVDRQVRRLSVVDFPAAPEVLSHLHVPKSFSARSANSRRDLANELRLRSEGLELHRPRRVAAHREDHELAELRRAMRAHPCHGCADREAHARWAERAARLGRETRGLTNRMSAKTDSIARRFDALCQVLSDLGYLQGEGDAATVTPLGLRLARIYGESDLVAMECLRAGAWEGLSPAELAAVASALVYQSRGGDSGGEPPGIPGQLREVLSRTDRIRSDVEELAARHRLDPPRQLDLGFVWPIYRWAGGQSLARVLAGAELTGGDFVRWAKQVIDFLGQLADAQRGTQLAADARTAATMLRRGVVAVSSIEGAERGIRGAPARGADFG
ncbi:MAG: DEAD/DEAH box helicase [Candidatus Nanopelagicales bacterium]